jgi:hypothetical protein
MALEIRDEIGGASPPTVNALVIIAYHKQAFLLAFAQESD